MNESGESLFQRFISAAFEGLIDDEPLLLSKWLRERGGQTGRAGLVFIAEAIDAVYTLFLDHDQQGGVHFDFIREVDKVVYEYLPVIKKAEVHWEAKLAKDFRDRIISLTLRYDPREYSS